MNHDSSKYPSRAKRWPQMICEPLYIDYPCTTSVGFNVQKGALDSCSLNSSLIDFNGEILISVWSRSTGRGQSHLLGRAGHPVCESQSIMLAQCARKGRGKKAGLKYDSLAALVSRRPFTVREIKGNMSAVSVYWVERLGQIAHDVGYRWSGPWVKMKVWRGKRRATMFYLNILRETTGSGNLLCYNSVPRSPPSAAITASA